MKNFIFLFVFITISNLAYSSALPDDDYLPNQPHPSDPDYTQPKIPKKTNIPTNTPPANDPVYEPPKTKPKPGKLPNPGKLGGIIGSIVGDYIIGKVDEGLDWILDPANHEPKRKPLPQPKTQYKVECKGYGGGEIFDSATDYLESLIYDLEKKGWYDVKFIEYKDNNKNYSRQLGRFYGVFSGEDEYGQRHTFNYGDVICRRAVKPKKDKTPQGPDATPPQPQPNPNNEPAPNPRPGTEPSPRPGTEPSPRPGTEPSPRPGTEPSPRPGTEPSPRPGTEPSPRPGTEPSPRPGTEPSPRPGTEPSPRPGTEPSPRPGTEPSPRPGTEPSPRPGTEPSPRPGTEPSPRPGTEPSPRPGTEPSPRPGVNGKDGKDGKSASSAKPFELPKFCDWAKWFCEGEIDKPNDTDVDVEPQELPQNVQINFSRGCPADRSVPFVLAGHEFKITLTYKYVCRFMSSAAILIQMISTIVALFILTGIKQ